MKSFQSAEQALAYYTECQLATLEGLRIKKRTPLCELQRHQKIADGMVEHCKAFVKKEDAVRTGAIRLHTLLNAGEDR